MNLERMYIISWFGNDEVREKRVDYHNRQIEWALKNNLEVYVFSQEYQSHEFNENVHYLNHKNDNVLLPAEARNICLHHFYNSDCDYAIIADNDSVLHEGEQHCDSKDFVSIFNSIPLSELKEVDFFFPLNPGKIPFNKTIKKQNFQFENFLIFERNTDSKGSFCVLKNLEKFYGQRIYYDEQNFMTKDRQIITHEDVDFGLQMLDNGFSCYMLKNIILKEYATSTSTWTKQEDRSNVMTTGKDILKQKYKLSTSGGNMDYSVLYNANKRSKKLMISKCKTDGLFVFK